MTPDRTKTCTVCGCTKPLEEMCQVQNRGRPVYYRSVCVACDNKRAQHRRDTGAAKKWEATRLAKQRHERTDLAFQDKYIFLDSRGSDRKSGRPNDLDREFIREAIKNGCAYCGETELRMTLDRIDNEKGHTKDNVVPACLRCNATRHNMPYKAWLIVAKGMREAREVHAFGNWTGRRN